ncbi:MAG: MBL fold metallo-hydrolase [Gammaproteobacteria bacterium]|nr:MBL fold metallo-hydrolase [Gammaproteobacteria bacterium]
MTGAADVDAVSEFCLDGEFDLGMRLQGLQPEVRERYPTRFCVVTEGAGARVHFSAFGYSNPDMADNYAVSYFPPDRVRLVNRDSPPDIDFAGKPVLDESLRYRRLDPRRLLEELAHHPEYVDGSGDNGWLRVRYPGSPYAARIRINEERLHELRTFAELPLRGRVETVWTWDWSDPQQPVATLEIDRDEVFVATGTWRQLSDAAVATLWDPSNGEQPREIPGDRWPARVNMRLITLADGVYVMRGVRTGFHHIVVETDAGLVVGDAPAGWVELPQIPPADLVPGLGISGLSQGLIDYLGQEFAGIPVRAVALTHVHDDHAGGARAFAASGAAVYAPAGVAAYLQQALNRPRMPTDALRPQNAALEVTPVATRLLLDDETRPVELLEIGRGPHVEHSLGILEPKSGYFFQSDLHVPNSEADEPRPDRAATECWFARWAVANLPQHAVVINTHTTIETPLPRLARYLESAACQALGAG